MPAYQVVLEKRPLNGCQSLNGAREREKNIKVIDPEPDMHLAAAFSLARGAKFRK